MSRQHRCVMRSWYYTFVATPGPPTTNFISCCSALLCSNQRMINQTAGVNSSGASLGKATRGDGGVGNSRGFPDVVAHENHLHGRCCAAEPRFCNNLLLKGVDTLVVEEFNNLSMNAR